MRYARHLAAVPALALLVALTFGAGATAQGPFPNITVTGFSAPSCVELGQSIGSSEIAATENNVGSASVPPPPPVPPGEQPCPPGTFETTCSAIGLYVSADATITTADTLLTGGRTNLFTLLGDGVSFGIGDSVAIDFGLVTVSPAPVQPPVPTGNVFIGIIGDETQQITEESESDNVVSQPILVVAAGSGGCGQPDLVVSSFTHEPANPTTADGITLTAVVENVGGATAAASTACIDVGGEICSNPTSEMLFDVPSLAPGASFAVIRSINLEVAQGYITNAEADVDDDVAESDEGNNTASDSFTVTAAAPVAQIYQVISLPDNGSLLGLSGCSPATPCNLPAFTVTYEPRAQFVGTDSFEYRIYDPRTKLFSAAAVIDILVAVPPSLGADLTVDFQGNGVGDVSLDVGGSVVAICDDDCTEDLGPGSVVKLQARPFELSTFGGWGGACSVAGISQIATITLPAGGATCTATFNP